MKKTFYLIFLIALIFTLVSCMMNQTIEFKVNGLRISGDELVEKAGEILNAGIGPKDIVVEIMAEAALLSEITVTVFAGTVDPVETVVEETAASNPLIWEGVEPGNYSVRVLIKGPKNQEIDYYFDLVVDAQLKITQMLVNDQSLQEGQDGVLVDPGEVVVFAQFNDTQAQGEVSLDGNQTTNPCTFNALPNQQYVIAYDYSNPYDRLQKELIVNTRASKLEIVDLLVDGVELNKDATLTYINEGPARVFAETNETDATITIDVTDSQGNPVASGLSSRGKYFEFVAFSNESYNILVTAQKDITTVTRQIKAEVLQGIALRANTKNCVLVGNQSSNPDLIKLLASSVNVDFVEAWIEFPEGHPNGNPNMKQLGIADVNETGEAQFDVNPFNEDGIAGISGQYKFWVRPVGEEDFPVSVIVDVYTGELTVELEDVGFEGKEIYSTEAYHRFKIKGRLFPGQLAKQTRWDLQIFDPLGNPISPVPYTNSQTTGSIDKTLEGTLTTVNPPLSSNPLFRLTENGLYQVLLSSTCDFGDVELSRSDKIFIHYSGADPLQIEDILINGVEIQSDEETVEVNAGDNRVFAVTNHSDAEIEIMIQEIESVNSRGSTTMNFNAEIGKQYEIQITATKDAEQVQRTLTATVKQGLDIDLSTSKIVITNTEDHKSTPEFVIGALSSSQVHTAEVYLKLPNGHPAGQGLIGPIFEETDISPNNVATFTIDPFNQDQIAAFPGEYVFYAKPFGEDFSASETLLVLQADVKANITDSEFIVPEGDSTDTYHQFSVSGEIDPGIFADTGTWHMTVYDPLGNHVQFIEGSGPASGKAETIIQGTNKTKIPDGTKTGLVKMTLSGTYTAVLTVSGIFGENEVEQTVQKDFYYEGIHDLVFEEIFVNDLLLEPGDEGTVVILEPGNINVYAASNYSDAQITMEVEEEKIQAAASRGKMFKFDGVSGTQYNIVLTAKKANAEKTFSFSVKIPLDVFLSWEGAPVVLIDDKHFPDETILKVLAEDYDNQVAEVWVTVPPENPLNSNGRIHYQDIAISETGEATLSIDPFEAPFNGIEGKYTLYVRIAGKTTFQASIDLHIYQAWVNASLVDEVHEEPTAYSSSAYHRFDVQGQVFPGKLANEKTWEIEILGENGGFAEIVPLSTGDLNGTVNVEDEGTLTTRTEEGLQSALLRLSQTDVYTATLTVQEVFDNGEVLTAIATQVIHFEKDPPEATLTLIKPKNKVVNNANNNRLTVKIEAFDKLAIGEVDCDVENATLETFEEDRDTTTYTATKTYVFNNIDGATSTINMVAKDKAGLKKEISDEVFVDVLAPRITQEEGSVLFMNETNHATEIDHCVDFKIATVTVVFSDPDQLLAATETNIVKDTDSNYTVYATYSAKEDVAEGNVTKTVIATDTSGNVRQEEYILTVDTKGPEPITPITGMIVFGEQADYVTLAFHEQINVESLQATLTIGNLKYSIDSEKTVYVPGQPFIYKTYYNCDLTTNPQPTIDIFVEDLYENTSYNTNLPVNVNTNSSSER